MYGRQGRLTARAGERGRLAGLLLRAAELVGALPGCRLYVVAEDPASETDLWVFEVWDDAPAHAASLQRDAVRALIGEARPLLDGAPQGGALNVLGGHGLPEG